MGDMIMNLHEVNSDKGLEADQEVMVGWRKALVTRDLMEVRKQSIGISGERAFQAEQQASEKIL
jgi:hypothetical protein